jgi:hypothetical protein
MPIWDIYSMTVPNPQVNGIVLILLHWFLRKRDKNGSCVMPLVLNGFILEAYALWVGMAIIQAGDGTPIKVETCI